MASLELIKRLGRQTKIQVLVTEACACDFSTSEIAELLDLLADGAEEKSALGIAALDALGAAGTPPGRIEDLRKAFGAPPGTGRSTTTGGVAGGAKTAGHSSPIKGSTTQQTRPVQSPFRARFDAAPPVPDASPAPEEPQGDQPAPPAVPRQTAPAAPRAPLPLRGKAAGILKGGTAAQTGVPVPPPPPAAPPPTASQRSGHEAQKSADTFFGGGRGKPSAESLLGPSVVRPTILLADDDKRIRMVYRLKLEEKGFNVLEAADGQEAWKRLEAGGISAAVLDMKMPGLHGLEILSRLADSGKDLPVVICTAYDRLDDEFVVATYPRLRYLTKPVDGDQLASTLNNLLAE
ncbi:MAG TPA: response regulator [Planctomycetota bacterium]|nr:response regulator [Planctomycetota bacterium]